MNVIWEIKKRFEEALQAKTSWGKNDVIKLYDDIVIQVLSEQIKQDHWYEGGVDPHDDPSDDQNLEQT